MAKLVHDKDGERYYSMGVSECVLFVKDTESETGGYKNGVAWNGISNITLSPEGAEENVVYADNRKYLSLRSEEELKATIEGYMSPEEFDVCDGTAQLSGTVRGVKLGQQTRVPFAFCYKSKKGNDQNPDLGYVIHIVYGCTASPTEHAYETINDSPEAPTLSWEVSATKVNVTGFKPTAHIEIDSTVVPEAKLTAIEDALYGKDPSTTQGNDGSDSHLLTPDEIIAILNAQ